MNHQTVFDDYFRKIIQEKSVWASAGHASLKESVLYSCFSGGKRFRPTITLMMAEALGLGVAKALPFAASLEMVHTYSLIHDDLPCMDNDDFRRGAPTNHKKFGEATALLAGDALLTEAFLHIAKSYLDTPSLGLKLTALLGEAAGFSGMVGGQAMDLASSSDNTSVEQLMLVHSLKTGRLIEAAALGPAIISQADAVTLTAVENYGKNLGLAFQIADDLLDAQDPNQLEESNLVGLYGKNASLEVLQKASTAAKDSLSFISDLSRKEPLMKLVDFNISRQH